MKHKWLVLFFTFLALFLRLFRLGLNDFKEDEYNSVNAATYLYSCQKDSTNCHFSNNPIDTNITNKLLVILTNNETKPNLFTEIYLWDWIKKAPTKTHYARAWPHLYNLTNIYSLFGISEFSSRLISVISGSLLIIVSFFFSFLFIGSVNLSLVYSLMITFSFYLIDISRNARMYSSFILIFQVLVYFTYRAIFESQTRQKNLIFIILSLASFITAYFFHLITLLFPLAVLIFSYYFGFVKKQAKPKNTFYFLLIGLIFFIILNLNYNLDFFQTQFSQLSIPPKFKYLKFVFSHPLPFIFNLSLIIINLPFILRNKKASYLFTIIITYLGYLIFFSKPTPASAYTLHLLPLSLALFLIALNHQFPKKFVKFFIYFATLLFVLIQLISKIPYLYLAKHNQPQITQAYQLIIKNYQADDQILAVHLRDYYLKALPQAAQITEIPDKQSLSFSDFLQLLNQAPSSYIVWEQEKQVHLRPAIVDYIQAHATKLAGEEIDNYKVEIYYYQK